MKCIFYDLEYINLDIPRTIEEIVKRFGLAFKLNILELIRIVSINDPVMLKVK